MALHSRLAQYASEEYISRFNDILKMIELDELNKLQCREWEVGLIRVGKTTLWERFCTLSNVGSQTEQIMFIRGRVTDIQFNILIPMALGYLQPYTLDIRLRAPIDGAAKCRRGFLWKKWELSPGNPDRLKQLKRLGLPAVNFDHSWGGYKYRLSVGHQIIADEKDVGFSRWIVNSGYQGFVFGVGPRVAKYVQAAPRLESLLNEWNQCNE